MRRDPLLIAATVMSVSIGQTCAQETTPPCGPDAQGMYTSECHAALLDLERKAQHARSYSRGYGDGCKARDAEDGSVARMIIDAEGTFHCKRTLKGLADETGKGTTALVPWQTSSPSMTIPGWAGSGIGTTSLKGYDDPATTALIDDLIEDMGARQMLQDRGFALTPIQ